MTLLLVLASARGVFQLNTPFLLVSPPIKSNVAVSEPKDGDFNTDLTPDSNMRPAVVADSELVNEGIGPFGIFLSISLE